MSNTMCGNESAPVSASVPTTNNAAAMQYANIIKRVANNDTIAIREMVRWLITATESFDLPQMHDALSRIAILHEKRTNLILKEFDYCYITMEADDLERPMLVDILHKLMLNKKKTINRILNELVDSLTASAICGLRHQMLDASSGETNESVINMTTIAILHDYIGRTATAESVRLESYPTVGPLVTEKIRKSRDSFNKQTETMDTLRGLTLDELGWNFRRLADYCDELNGVMKGDRGSGSNGCCHSKAQCKCHGKRDVSSSESSHDLQTPYGLINKDLNHLLWLISGLVATTIIPRYQEDSRLLEVERKINADTHRELEKAKIKDIKSQLSAEEQIDLIVNNLNSLIVYIEVCRVTFLNKSQESQSASK